MKLTEQIYIDKELKEFIIKNKEYPRETSNDVLRRLLKIKEKICKT